MDDRLTPPVVFMHIPKTAGTSLRQAFVSALGQDAVSAPFVVTRIDEERARDLNDYSVISGHICRQDQLKWFPDRRLLIVVRPPIDRCVSWIYYVKSLQGTPLAEAANSLPIEEFIAHNKPAQLNLSNRMVRQLGGHIFDEEDDMPALLEAAKETLREALWVGRQDHFAPDIKRLELLLPILSGRLPTLKENVTTSKPTLAELDSSVLSLLGEMNAYDLELWDWATKNLDFNVDG